MTKFYGTVTDLNGTQLWKSKKPSSDFFIAQIGAAEAHRRLAVPGTLGVVTDEQQKRWELKGKRSILIEDLDNFEVEETKDGYIVPQGFIDLAQTFKGPKRKAFKTLTVSEYVQKG